MTNNEDLREMFPEKKKKSPARKKDKAREEALLHIERVRTFGHQYYKKSEVIKLLREFVRLYM